MGKAGLHSRMQAGIITRLLSSLKDPGEQGTGFLRTGKGKCNARFQERPRELQAAQPNCNPRQMMEQILLEAVSRQHGFTKGKLCLTNLLAFCD